MQPWKAHGTIDPNSLGLAEETVRHIAPNLDRHLASLFVLFHQYQKHHWLVEGPQFRDLHLLLGESYEEVHKHVDEIAERMTLLGAIPTCNPVEQARLAVFQHEPEGSFRIRQMLEADRAAEGKIAQDLRGTIKLAFELGDFGTETLLRGVLTSVEDRAHHLDHFLGDDSLERGLKS